MEKPKGLDDYFDYDEYRAYINSEIWDQKRTERLIFDDFECQLCGCRSNVQVHHLVYPLHKNFGTEPINDLITVCPKCHQLLDGLRKGQEIKPKPLYKTHVTVECFLIFDSIESFEEEYEYLKKYEDSYGSIALKGFLKTPKASKHIGFITIKDYLNLFQKYGSKRTQLKIRRY